MWFCYVQRKGRRQCIGTTELFRVRTEFIEIWLDSFKIMENFRILYFRGHHFYLLPHSPLKMQKNFHLQLPKMNIATRRFQTLNIFIYLSDFQTINSESQMTIFAILFLLKKKKKYQHFETILRLFYTSCGRFFFRILKIHIFAEQTAWKLEIMPLKSE